MYLSTVRHSYLNKLQYNFGGVLVIVVIQAISKLLKSTEGYIWSVELYHLGHGAAYRARNLVTGGVATPTPQFWEL